ncbi:PREDICTED: glutathione S-transferase U10-like [Fragaria vesca subsp. vesca]|uniref:glutathione S-transferase U10-like n=1 Tax=Fragaria vesca subsp. vesca TaxID=101020 RepID=UPI0002C3238A|nr:PREDICTED: glutathione S-transferase U10-like [Fragaria vesca subsp. vesca]
MEGESSVKLHEMWASTYSKRVELALKLKGIPYEYMEEDFTNKSQLLLKYNPVHKKVPVLVHDGKPIAESYIILEYIDETWKTGPKLFPEDPYERAKFRFWASFIQQQLFESFSRVVISQGQGEALEQAVKDVFERLGVFEEGMKEYLAGGASFTNGENLGLLDILMVVTFSPHKVHEEVFGIKTMDPDRYPLLFSWITALNEHPLVKQISPPHDKLVELLQIYKPTNQARGSESH